MGKDRAKPIHTTMQAPLDVWRVVVCLTVHFILNTLKKMNLTNRKFGVYYIEE